MAKKNDDRRERYAEKMKRLGFSKIQPWVHKDDKDEILKIIEQKREKRLNKSNK